MGNTVWRIVSVALLLVSGVSAAGLDDTTRTSFGTEVSHTSSEQFHDAYMAFTLLRYGGMQESPEALIAGVSIISSISLAHLSVEPVCIKRNERGNGQKINSMPDGSVLAKAVEKVRRLSGPHSDLTTRMNKAAAAHKKRGRAFVSQATYNMDQDSAHVYDLEVSAGQTIEIAVVGSGSSGLDLFVYDSAGTPVTSCTDCLDIGSVKWTVKDTGRFRVRVENEGSAKNTYTILFNARDQSPTHDTP